MTGWPDGRMAGWLDGWMAGWLDGWMAGWLAGRSRAKIRLEIPMGMAAPQHTHTQFHPSMRTFWRNASGPTTRPLPKQRAVDRAGRTFASATAITRENPQRWRRVGKAERSYDKRIEEEEDDRRFK